MKRVALAFVIILTMVSLAWADSYESVEIAGSSTGLTATTYGRARSALCRLETAEIRYTLDGSTVPTDAIGILLEPFEWIILENANQIKNFRGYRTGGTSGVLKCFYFD